MIFSAGIESGVIDFYLQNIFAYFDPEFYEIRLVRSINCNGFELQTPKFAPNMHIGIISDGIENELLTLSFRVIWLFQFHFGVQHHSCILI